MRIRHSKYMALLALIGIAALFSGLVPYVQSVRNFGKEYRFGNHSNYDLDVPLFLENAGHGTLEVVDGQLHALMEEETRYINETAGSIDITYGDVVLVQLPQGDGSPVLHQTPLESNQVYHSLSYHNGLFYTIHRNWYTDSGYDLNLLGFSTDGELAYNSTYPAPDGRSVDKVSLRNFDVQDGKVIMHGEHFNGKDVEAWMEIRDLESLELEKRSAYPYGGVHALSWEGDRLYVTSSQLPHKSSPSGGTIGLNVVEFNLADDFSFDDIDGSVLYTTSENHRDPVFEYEGQKRQVSVIDYEFSEGRLYKTIGLGYLDMLEIEQNTFSEVLLGYDKVSILPAYPMEVLPRITAGVLLIIAVPFSQIYFSMTDTSKVQRSDNYIDS